MSISLTINEQAVTAEPGMTVLEAARANGVYIPTLCYAPRLKPFGGCRMCVVEIEKRAGFPTACTEPVTAGMVVRTETLAVQQQRKETLALLLSEHPYTCLTCANKTGCVEFQGTIRKAAVTTGCQYCPKNGQCEIQQVLDHVCLTEVPYPITYRNLPVEQDDPFFDRDMNLCIVCGRCVRACQDVRHASVISLVERGDHTIVSTAAGHTLLQAGCQFCGACVDACPTGALFDKKSKWEGVPTATVASVCPYCAVGCSINVQTRSGKVLRAVGKEGGVTNDGEVCVRARFGVVDVVQNGARLKSPLVKHGRRLVPVDWDAALDTVAQGLAQYHGDQFAAIGSATATNEDLYMLQKFARVVMKSNSVALATAFPNVAAVASELKAGAAPISAVREAATILVIGSNPFDSHPIVGLEIRHALSRGATLIVADPQRSKAARQAQRWLPLQPSTDHVLVAGLLKALAAAGKDSGLPMLKRVSLRRVAAQTGVHMDDVEAAAHVLASGGPVVIIYGSGVTHQSHAEDTIKAVRSLAAVLGAVVIGLPGEGNVVGAYDMGCTPSMLPGYKMSRHPGRDYRAIVDGIRKGDVKALYLAGDVPPLPELAQVPFLVVQGIVHAEIMKHAQVVLPATTFAEVDGTMTNLEGRVQRLRQVIKPVGQARPGWMILRDLAARMGTTWAADSATDVLAEISKAVPGYTLVNEQTLGEHGVLRRLEPAPSPQAARFGLNGLQPSPCGDKEVLLLTERNTLSYNGVCLTKEVKGLDQLKAENVLRVSPADAGRLGIIDGKPVQVRSASGSAYLTAQVDGSLPQGAASVSINPVVGSPLFPDLTPHGKSCVVSIEVSE